MSTTLYPYQEEGVALLNDFGGRALLADDVGLGKTVQALWWAHHHLPANPPGPIVCVVPSHLKINWKREVQKHLGQKAGNRVEILSGQQVPADKLPPIDRNQTYVINYEILVPPRWSSRKPLPANSWAAFLRDLEPRLLIADEAHYLANAGTARTRAVRALAKTVRHVILLTATPLTNKPENLWPLLNIIRPNLFPSRFDFLVEYTHACKMPWAWEFKGARNLDVLHKILTREVMIRRRKRDVLTQLPILTTSVYEIEVDLRQYRRAENEFLTWLAEQSPEKAERAAKAETITRMTYLRQLAGQLKIDATMAFIEDMLHGTDLKLLLGALHHKFTGALIEAYGDRRAVLIDGNLNHVQKQAAFDRFNLDPKCRLCIGNIHAAGSGWSCTATSDVAIAELPWRPGDCKQFIGRVDGLERGIPGVAAHNRYLVALGTIDEDIAEVVQRKQTWLDEALDGGPQGDDGLDIYDQILESMRRRAGMLPCHPTK